MFSVSWPDLWVHPVKKTLNKDLTCWLTESQIKEDFVSITVSLDTSSPGAYRLLLDAGPEADRLHIAGLSLFFSSTQTFKNDSLVLCCSGVLRVVQIILAFRLFQIILTHENLKKKCCHWAYLLFQRSRSRSKEQDRSRSKEEDRSRSRDTDRSRSREKNRSRERDRNRSREKDRSTSRGRARSRSRSRGQDRSRSRGRERSRSRGRDRSRSRERDRYDRRRYAR